MIVAMPAMVSTALAPKLADAEKHMVLCFIYLCGETRFYKRDALSICDNCYNCNRYDCEISMICSLVYPKMKYFAPLLHSEIQDTNVIKSGDRNASKKFQLR